MRLFFGLQRRKNKLFQYQQDIVRWKYFSWKRQILRIKYNISPKWESVGLLNKIDSIEIGNKFKVELWEKVLRVFLMVSYMKFNKCII